MHDRESVFVDMRDNSGIACTGSQIKPTITALKHPGTNQSRSGNVDNTERKPATLVNGYLDQIQETPSASYD